MSDVIMTDEDGTRYSYENITTQGWLLGHTSGLDAAVEFLKERAVVLFRAGKDDEATRMRRLADEMKKELEPSMRARVERHEKEHPAVILDDDD